ncbi:MAG: hypothetical protein M3015_17775 [Bacteroidota bacterium]|nr:hypothetical protein [Bacteroidota bacterium]
MPETAGSKGLKLKTFLQVYAYEQQVYEIVHLYLLLNFISTVQCCAGRGQ